MLTNPNTLGIFEQEIHKIADVLHALDRARFAPAVPQDVLALAEQVRMLRARLAAGRAPPRPPHPPFCMAPEPLLPPESLERYADAIVRASLGIEKGDTLVVQGEPEHRELLVAVAESAPRAKATLNGPGGAGAGHTVIRHAPAQGRRAS